MNDTSSPAVHRGEPADDTSAVAPDTLHGRQSLVAASVAATLFPAHAPVRSLGRFEIEGVLGAGGMASVYRAYDPRLERHVAIKVAHQGVTDPAGGQQALTEARALARLTHPNVVAVHEVGSEGELAFVVMELVPGEPLDAWLAARPRRVPEILEVFAAAAHGLAAVHALGVVHRDFKPGNVLVGPHGEVKVVDFGLAQAIAAPPGDQAIGGRNVAGTPRYMSPEQLDGVALDARSDQYSFCASLAGALSGTKFVRGARRWNRSGPAGDRIPRRLRRVVERGLATDPGVRWPSMEILAQRLVGRRVSRAGLWAVAASTGVTAVLALASRPAPCAAQIVHPAWQPGDTVELGAHLVSADGGIGAARAQFIADGLDEWMSSWRAAVDEVCEQETAEQRLQRLRCLEVLTYDFEAVRRGAAALAVDGDGDVAAGLPSRHDIDGCLRGDAQRLAARMPATTQLAQTVREMRRELAQMRHSTLPPEQRDDQYQALIARATATGFAPLEREVHRAHSEWSDAGGSKPATFDSLGLAYRAAVRSDDHERAALDAMDAAIVGAALRRDPQLVQMWLTHAQTHVDAVPDDAIVAVALARSRGVVAMRSEQLELAVVELEHAYDRSLWTRGAERGIDALSGLVESYARLGQHTLACEAAELYLELLEDLPDAAIRKRVGGHLNASSGYAHAGDMAMSEVHLRRGLAVAKGRLAPTSYLRALLENNLGVLAAPLDPRRAIEHLWAARGTLAEQLPGGHPMLVRLDVEMGQAMFALGDVRGASDCFERAVAVGSPDAAALQLEAELQLDAWRLEAASLRPDER